MSSTRLDSFPSLFRMIYLHGPIFMIPREDQSLCSLRGEGPSMWCLPEDPSQWSLQGESSFETQPKQERATHSRSVKTRSYVSNLASKLPPLPNK